MISNERRSARRFLLRLPLTVLWIEGSVVDNAATESQDVSFRGLYFHLPNGRDWLIASKEVTAEKSVTQPRGSVNATY